MARPQGSRSRRPAKQDRLAVARRVLIVVVLVAVIVIAVLIVSHRKNTPSAGAGGTTATTAQTATGPGPHQKQVTVPLSTTLTIARLAQESDRAHTATFSATYSSTDVPGAPAKVQLEQTPSEQLFKSGTAELITHESTAYYCVLSKAPVCQTASAAGNPFPRVVGLYQASSYDSTLHTMGNLLHTGAVYDFSNSQSTVGGQKSDCLSWGHEHSKVNYCVTPGGVLTEFTISANSTKLVTFAIQLTHYSPHAAPGDFQLPKNATVSIPGPKSVTPTTARKTAKATTSKHK